MIRIRILYENIILTNCTNERGEERHIRQRFNNGRKQIYQQNNLTRWHFEVEARNYRILYRSLLQLLWRVYVKAKKKNNGGQIMTTATELIRYYSNLIFRPILLTDEFEFEMRLILPFYKKLLETRVKPIPPGLTCIWNYMACANICNARINPRNERRVAHENTWIKKRYQFWTLAF